MLHNRGHIHIHVVFLPLSACTHVLVYLIRKLSWPSLNEKLRERSSDAIATEHGEDTADLALAFGKDTEGRNSAVLACL